MVQMDNLTSIQPFDLLYVMVFYTGVDRLGCPKSSKSSVQFVVQENCILFLAAAFLQVRKEMREHLNVFNYLKVFDQTQVSAILERILITLFYTVGLH